MVLQVLPDTGEVGDQADAQVAQLPGRADAGQQEQLRRADRARAHDHLTSGVRRDRGAAGQVPDARAPAMLYVQAGDQAAGLDCEVGAVPGGCQVGIGRADPLPDGDSQVGPGHPFLAGAAEISGHRVADLGQGGGERDRDRMPAWLGDRADPDRACGSP